MRLRRATVADVPGMIAVQRSLPLRASGAGGFLLGSDAARYEALVVAASAFVAVDPDPVGFAIGLPDALVRGSDLWERRAAIDWTEDPARWEAGRVAYFDQLAVTEPTRRRPIGVALAVAVLEELLDGHDVVFTTTVREPVENRAAWALIARAGGRRVGTVAEDYPGHGRIVSDLHAIEAPEARRVLAEARGAGRRRALVDAARGRGA